MYLKLCILRIVTRIDGMRRHKVHDLFCLCCGKKVDFLLDGKFCSADCADDYSGGPWHRHRFCNNCGAGFSGVKSNVRFCDRCRAAVYKCICFYPEYWKNHNKDSGRMNERKSVFNDSFTPVQKTRGRKKKMSELASFNEEARKLGLSYGQLEGRRYMVKKGLLRDGGGTYGR